MKFEAMNGNLLPLTVKTKPGISTTGIGDGGENETEDAADTHTEMKLLADELEFTNNINDGNKILAENKIEEKCEEHHDENNKTATTTTTTTTVIEEEELDEATAVADGLDKEETSEGSKKKGTRKKRSINWEETERSLLLEVIKPKADFVENRNIDAKNIKAKHLAWLHITKQFNSLNFRHRSLDQIKVQWRSLKNLAKREYQLKPDKAEVCLEGANLVEFLEELLKETNILRPHNKTAGGGNNKKEPNDIDDEDTPLAALPAVTHSSDENTTQTSNTTMALPSPPLSAADSQNEIVKETVTSTRKRKRSIPQSKQKQKDEQDLTETLNGGAPKPKRQRAQTIKKEAVVVDSTSNNRKLNDIQTTSIEQSALAMALSAGTEKIMLHSPTDANITHSSLNALNDLAKTNLGNAQNNNSNNNMINNNTSINNNVAISADVKYKKQLFELLKHARLTEMDYLRRDYEQKLRFAQMEQDLRMNFSRQMEELKMRLMREEHDLRMRQSQAEHEARMRIYTTKGTTQVRHANNEANENMF